MNIGKELYCEIKGIDIEVCRSVSFDSDHSSKWIDEEKNVWDCEENIYEFYFEMKKWAFSKGFEITSGRTKKDNYICFIQECTLSKLYDFYDDNNEINATIKACEWILKNEKNTK